MTAGHGYYSLVQFCPDLSRLEGVNVGVVLYAPANGQIEVQMTRNNERVRRLFGDQDWDFVRKAKNAIKTQLKTQHFSTLADLQSFISKRANSIQMTPLRPIRICDIQQDIASLHERLVGPERVERKMRVDRRLNEKLKEAGVANLVKRSISVNIPRWEQPIRVPYGYQNGKFNLISPVQFEPDIEQILAKAGKSTLESQLISERPDPIFGNMRLVVVADFASEVAKSTRDLVEKTLREHHVTFHLFDQLDLLVEDIRRSAEQHA